MNCINCGKEHIGLSNICDECGKMLRGATMKVFIILMLLVLPANASCICPDGTVSQTEEELVQEKQDLEIRLHNMSVMNQRAEAGLRQEIAEKESAMNKILLKKVVIDIKPVVYDDINWGNNILVEENVY